MHTTRTPSGAACLLVMALPLLTLLSCGQGGQPVPAVTAASSASGSWEQTVAAAKREGALSIAGQGVPETTQALTRGFQSLYPEIKVEYEGTGGADLPPKVIAEHGAGQFTRDVFVQGTAFDRILADASALDPIQSYLVGPEAKEASNPARWMSPNFEPTDDVGKYVHLFAYIAKVPLAYNPALVAPGEIKSYKDLLNPKWKDKLTIHDPRSGGAGQGMAAFLLASDGLGKEYLQQLLAQNLVLNRDERQLLDGTIRGQFAVALAPSELVISDLRSKGVTVPVLGAQDLAEGSFLTVGAAVAAVFAKPPHPNATRVYLDWLLSADAQLAYSKATNYVSRRKDVPTDHLPAYSVAKPGVRYLETWQASYFKKQQDAGEFFRTAYGA